MKCNDTTRINQRATEHPIQLPPADRAGCTKLRRWREAKGYDGHQAAAYLGVSQATYYRYEAGFIFNIQKANRIVEMTHGKVRYRDLIGGFNPEYA